MLRCAVLLSAVLMMLASPAPLLAQSSAEGVIADIDAFWFGKFEAAGLAYASPGVVALDGPLDTPCGPIDPAWGPGAYCGGDQTIYYSPRWFGVLSAGENDFA